MFKCGGNIEKDKSEWHALDMVKGGDYLTDQDAAMPLVEETAQASRFIDDSRDEGFEERIPNLDYPDGVWPRNNTLNAPKFTPAA